MRRSPSNWPSSDWLRSGGIFVAVLRGLWVKLEPPKGQVLAREQAPKLFALLDELRKCAGLSSRFTKS